MYTVYTMKNGFFRGAIISTKSRWHQSVGALNLDYLPMARRIPLRLFPPVHFNSRYLRRKSVVHRPTPVKVASPSTGLPGPLHAWLWGDESTAKWRSIKDISMDFFETELFADLMGRSQPESWRCSEELEVRNWIIEDPWISLLWFYSINAKQSLKGYPSHGKTSCPIS